MRENFKDLQVTVLDREMHERTCGYWFVIRAGTFAHTAFPTVHGVLRWISERGLSLSEPLTEAGTWSTQRIIGEYRTESHLDAAEVRAWSELPPVIVTRVMSNGDYVEGRITLDADGIRTVHYLNPNVRGRWVFNHGESRTRENTPELEADSQIYACPDGAACTDPKCVAEYQRRLSLRSALIQPWGESCPRCGTLTHASESNDDGVCATCLGPAAVTP